MFEIFLNVNLAKRLLVFHIKNIYCLKFVKVINIDK